MRSTVFAATCLGLVLSTGSGIGQEQPGFTLLPGEGQVAGTATSGQLTFSSDVGGTTDFSIFSPLRATENGLFLYDIGIGASFDDAAKLDAFMARAGLVYRFSQGEGRTFGLNAYVDGASPSDVDETLGLMSFGAEFEQRFVEASPYIQAGANYYVPFADYTDLTRYPSLTAAPREGFDTYVSLGRDFDGMALRGTLEGFNYLETGTALSLSGYGVSLDAEYWRDLPKGMTVTASLGLRDDTRSGVDPSLRFGLGLDYTFGNSGVATVPTNDCAVVRDGVSAGRIDCAESVIAAMGGEITTKEYEQIIDDSVAPANAIRLTPPRRNIGFGTIMTPIESQPEDTTPVLPTGTGTLQIVKVTSGNYSGRATDFTFDGSDDSLDATLSVPAGVNQQVEGSAQTLAAGTYTVTETNIPTDFTFLNATCTGADATRTSNGVSITLTSGAQVVCTFENSNVGQCLPTDTSAIICGQDVCSRSPDCRDICSDEDGRRLGPGIARCLGDGGTASGRRCEASRPNVCTVYE